MYDDLDGHLKERNTLKWYLVSLTTEITQNYNCLMHMSFFSNKGGIGCLGIIEH